MSRHNNWETLWSPYNPEKFICYSTNDTSSEIYLYNVFSKKEFLSKAPNNKQVVVLTDDVYASPVTGFSDYSSIKSVDWCPRKDLAEHCILALGLSNGKLSILNIGQEPSLDTHILLSQEFVPKYERTCHEVSWNKNEHNLVAVALDKVRYENSLIVWDIESKGGFTPLAGVEYRPPFTPMNKKTLYEHGSGEQTVSVKWLQHTSRTLIAGQGSKWLRILDMRTPNQTPKTVITTKAINGICVDPFNHHRIAAFIEGEKGHVCIWDIRQHDKALETINISKPISKISWCPTRNDLLSVLQKDSAVIKNYDLQFLAPGNMKPYSGNMDDETDRILERSIQLPKSGKSPISSYSWHPSIENTVLTATTLGTLHYLKVFELITMSWSPSNQLVWGCGKHMITCSHKVEEAIDEDISEIMHKRAVLGYGEPNVMKNEARLKEILNDVVLSKLWSWLRKLRKQRDESRKPRKFFGVKAIIKGEMNALDYTERKKIHAQNSLDKSKGVVDYGEKTSTASKKGGRFTKTTIDDGGNGEEVSFARSYTSDERKLALSLCEWDLTSDYLTGCLKQMAERGEAERAAAMALFLDKIDLTIDILSGSANKSNTDPSLPIVAMALSGYSEKRSTMWRNNCMRLSSKLSNAYLRAIFAFLTAEDEDFTAVLKETDMELGDRIAFACRYLSDTKLLTYVENVTTTMITHGNLEGLLLTGLTSDGIDLLENFITKTSDVQSAILIALTSKSSETLKDSRVVSWRENYRDLLDRWCLWHERAQFDALAQNTDGPRKILEQISVACTYCGKSVSYNMLSSGSARGQTRYLHGVGASRQNKAMSCVTCRQQLPRCSVCLINMGSLSSHAPRSGSKVKLDRIVNPFQNWFTWCQNCRHGGHAAHLTEWFEEHTECPVTGCMCCCNVLDSVAMVTPKQSVPVDSSEEIGNT